MSRDQRARGGDQGHGQASGQAAGTAGSDAIAQGHTAVQLLEGGSLFPRISTWAAHAIETANFAAAREASMRWNINRPYLRTLAQSLDPTDHFVARAQALLDDMAPLEAKLPDLIDLAGSADSAKGKARWLARLGRAEKAKAAPAEAASHWFSLRVEEGTGQEGTAPDADSTRAAAPAVGDDARLKVKLELTGLAGLFRLYQRHRDTADLEVAYSANTVDDESVVPPNTSLSDAAWRELDAALRANGFTHVREFEALIRQYERDFEAGAAEVVLAMLDRYKSTLTAEVARYRSREVVQALHAKLGGFRGHHRAEEAAVAEHGRTVMGMQFGIGASRPTVGDVTQAGQRVAEAEAQAAGDLESLAADHPVLRDGGLPDSRRLDRTALASASPDQLGPMLERNLAQRLADIAQVRAQVTGHPSAVYKMDRLFPQFYAALGIAAGSVFDLIIEDKRHRDASEDILGAIGLAVLATALSVASFGTATPALAAAAGMAGAGVGAYTAYQDYQAYVEQNDLADLGFTDQASVGWLIVSFVGAGVDIGGAASAAKAAKTAKTANAIGRLKPFAEAIDAGGDVAEFTKAVQALEAAGELEAKAARAAERAAASRAEMVKALWDLGGATSGKLNAILGPFTDPAVYKAIFNIAKTTWRSGLHSAEAFFERLRMARNLKVIDDLTAEELAIAKRAWQEGKAAAEAEEAKNAARAAEAALEHPPHPSWDPELGEALERELREATIHNKQGRVAETIQKLSRSPHGAELARRLLDPRIRAAKGYEGIVQRLLSIDEARQAELIAELVDAAHLLEKGDMAKQTLSLGEKSEGTRAGDPNHYDMDSALQNSDGTFADGIQTYRPSATDVHAVIEDLRGKVRRQLRAAPAAKRVLAVHVDDEMLRLLQAEYLELARLATDNHIEIELVLRDGTRLDVLGGGS
jgi:hypothetical protein